MDSSAFPDLWARVMFRKVFKLARAVGECKLSKMIIIYEIHEQVHTIFYLLYNQQSYSIAMVCSPYVFARMFHLNRSKI